MKSRKHIHKIFKAVLIGCFFIPLSYAELTVIEDLGGESAVHFYEPIQPVHTDNAPKHPNAVPSQITEEQMLPVVSHLWSVGQVTPRKLDLPGATPLFLVGADETSLNWLTQNRQRLIDMGAMGLVIQVKNMEQLRILRNAVPELTLMPAPADTLSERLRLRHYPALITSEGISQ